MMKLREMVRPYVADTGKIIRQAVKDGTVVELPEELKPMADGIHTNIYQH